MIFRRPMGSETEFGVICPGRPKANETVLSTLVVDSYDDAARHAGWDYRTESPLDDARGFTVPERAADPTQLTHRGHVLTSEDIARELIEDSPDLGNPAFWENAVMNRVLPNGARFYVDHAHPEYSAPETTHPWDAVVWDTAGDRIAHHAAQAIAERYRETWPEPVLLYKNNTDNKSVSYGYHENYLVPRSMDFGLLAEHMIPFLATRQVITGAGRAGIGADSVRPGFQISQRADFFEKLIGLETTIRRPIVNTRDEPHANAAKYRRLHVIPGDANLSQTATLLKFASASAVLTLIEHGEAPDLRIAEPVRAMREISHDPTLRHRVELADGRRLTALEIQRSYAEAAQGFADRRGDLDARDRRVFDIWWEVLDGLAQDPMGLADRLDWVAKYALIRSYRDRGVPEDSPKIQALDLQYADLRPEKSLHAKLVALGRMRTLVPEQEVADAVVNPPSDTRAYLRGELVRRWPGEIHSAGWEVLAVRDTADDRIHRWLLDEPLDYGAQRAREVLDTSRSAIETMRRLGVKTVA